VTRSEEDTQSDHPAQVPSALPPIHESLLPRDHALHRPRHGKRQRAALTCAMAFFLVPTLAFVFGVRPQNFENHRLAAFPSPTEGWGFFTGLSNWATDHLPLRQFGVQAESGISSGLFGEPPAFSGTDRRSTGVAIGPIDQQQQPSGPTDFSQIVIGTNGWLYYVQDLTAKCMPDQPLSTTVTELNQLRAAVESSGRSFVLVVAPDKTTAVPRYLPAQYPDKDCAARAAVPFWDSAMPSVGALDLRPGLAAATQRAGVPAYYPQDTHWNDIGSLVMMRAVAEHIEPGVTSTWQSRPTFAVTSGADLPPIIGRTGIDTDLQYTLSPDGRTNRTGGLLGDLTDPVGFHHTPTTGMITTPVTLLGDSFLAHTSRFLPAVFSDATGVDYANLISSPQPVLSALVSSHVVVLEVVERYLTGGTAAFLRPQVISAIQSTLNSHPLH
jgi:alginate O-acetyltransferase complex protein AlgJ